MSKEPLLDYFGKLQKRLIDRRSMPLRLYLFGPLRAFVNEAPLKFPPRSKVGALLAYLLLQRERPVPRSLVAYALWPEEPEEAARANLRRHLHLLRNLLPPAPCPWLQQAGETIQMESAGRCLARRGRIRAV